jgi:hypothetical protein
MEAIDKNIEKNKPKRVLLTKRGVITSVFGDKKVSFRYISPSELKGIRRATYDYLIK